MVGFFNEHIFKSPLFSQEPLSRFSRLSRTFQRGDLNAILPANINDFSTLGAPFLILTKPVHRREFFFKAKLSSLQKKMPSF